MPEPEVGGYDLATLNGLVRGAEADARSLCRKCWAAPQAEGSPLCYNCLNPPCQDSRTLGARPFCGKCAGCKKWYAAIMGDVRQRFDPSYRGRRVTRTWIVSAICAGTILAWLWLLAAVVAR